MAEEPDYPTLLNVLKEKNKEVKNLQKKVERLEERYVSKHRENGDLLSDREALINFAQTVLDRTMQRDFGGCKAEELESLWASKEEEQKRLIRTMSQSSTDEIQKLKGELSRLKENLKQKEQESTEFRALEEQHSVVLSQMDEMRGEVEYLEKQIENLKVENARLKAQQEEATKNKTNSLIAALEQRPPTFSDDVPKLQKLLADAQARISYLESEINQKETTEDKEIEYQDSIQQLNQEKHRHETLIKELEDQLSETKNDFQEHRKRAQKLVLEKDQTIDRLKLKVKEFEKPSEESDQISSLKIRIEELEKSLSREDVNMEYLKNIVMKYMEYMYAGNLREATSLAYVIYTILNFTPEEIEVIRLARESSHIYSSVTGLFTVKSPGTGLSHNTIHTYEGRRRANLAKQRNDSEEEVKSQT